jgi:hypothetical protein
VIGLVGGALLAVNHLHGVTASAALVRLAARTAAACAACASCEPRLTQGARCDVQGRTEALGLLLGAVCCLLPSIGERLEEVRSRLRACLRLAAEARAATGTGRRALAKRRRAERTAGETLACAAGTHQRALQS